MVALLYLLVPLLLVYFLQHPTNLPIQKSFWLLYTFVITYLLVVWTLWHSEDWLDGLVKTTSLGVFFYATEIVVQWISKVVETYPSTPLQAVFTQTAVLKTQEHQQQESAQRLSLLVKQTPLAVIEWTTDFEVVDWNPAAEKIFGYGKHEALGRDGVELIVPESEREQVNLVWRQLLQQQGGTRSTNENVTKEGHKIYCEWYNTPLVNAKGEVIGVASLVQDISERKFAEEALQQAKNELEIRVEARTQELKQALAELQNVITQLQGEIDQRQQVEAALREREEQYR
ncbi:MAG: PAS domain S-box protein, partial [Tolypothrix sp. T3-bin4]|nr:PAS domain S-box protein [Tolypothrix sp. T3-bin4]